MAQSEQATAQERLMDPKVLQQLGSLRLRARAVVEGAISGLHRSALKGASVEFTEYKEYTPGDEIRHIDWRSFARTDRYFVKQFEDETNLRAFFMLDVSGSMRFQFEETILKGDYAANLVASLAYLFVRQGDAVGLLTFADEPKTFLPASAKRSHLEDLFRVIESTSGGQVGEGTDLTSALSRMAERAPRRSLVFLVSDMLDTSSSALRMAKVLRQRKNEVVVFHILDPAELSLPYEGLTLFQGLEEDGELLVDPDDIRERFQEELERHLTFLEKECRGSNIDYRRVLTTEPLDRVLLDFIHSRGG
ncbi:MAG: DUF58 domain-containing protein [Myxococcales bacterium]|nr:DUF58 domain-containing protein [Myxococcales bacterium]